jgi:hypothetical protein
MEQSERETTGTLPRPVYVLFVTTAGTLTLAWIAFLVWSVLKVLSLL